MISKRFGILLSVICFACLFLCSVGFAKSSKSVPSSYNVPDSSMFFYGDNMESKPFEFNYEFNSVIGAYHKNPGKDTEDKLRLYFDVLYNEELDRKRSKLYTLEKTVQIPEVLNAVRIELDNYEKYKDDFIRLFLWRVMDSRFASGIKEADAYGFVPLYGAPSNVSISGFPVTVFDYYRYLLDIGRITEDDNYASYAQNEEYKYLPVTDVTLADAIGYCEWLNSKKDGNYYRLPTCEEWELAAGPLPDHAVINNMREKKEITPVFKFSLMHSFCGAYDMWGNVWEWTSTSPANDSEYIVKGGSYDCLRSYCNTENRLENRECYSRYSDVGFRVVREASKI